MVFLADKKQTPLSPLLIALITVIGLTACSGDGSGGGITPPVLRDWEPGVFFNSANYADMCANPRTGTDPFYGGPVRDEQGRVADENNWLRSIHNAFYLWYDEVDDVDPASLSTPDYFASRKTTQSSGTMSGRDKDNFHSSITVQEYVDQLINGIDIGYGVRFEIVQDVVPREVVVKYTEPGSPADPYLSRGVRILSVDGIDLVNSNDEADIALLNAGLFPQSLNEVHEFVVRDLDSAERSFTLTSTEVVTIPVQQVGFLSSAGNTNDVGYILFNSHTAESEPLLVEAINAFIVDDVRIINHLILDLRYNGGGFLDIASELAYMIAGEAATMNKNFQRLQFNNKYEGRITSPISGRPLATPFYSTIRSFTNQIPTGTSLPTLDLSRVYIITSEETCSASEAIINGLLGVDVEVIQIGSTTCGKPYGSTALDNCGTFYLFTQFEGFNNKDEGRYSDGFEPADVGGFGKPLLGCFRADDLDHDFGASEENISTALSYINTGACVSTVSPPVSLITSSKIDGSSRALSIKKPTPMQESIVF